MIKKLLPAFIILLILSQLFGLALKHFAPDVHMVLKCIYMAVFTQIAGDILGRWLFKWPGHSWIYLRDYLYNHFIGSAGYLVGFAILWSVLMFYMRPSVAGWTGFGSFARGPNWLYQVVSSSLFPVLYYLYYQQYTINMDKREIRRLSEKI